MHEAFLKKIIENPDDDLPRLIYADWLEEQGNPRAEFIRIQCELAQRKANWWQLGEKLQIKQLKQRERELWKNHGVTWNWEYSDIVARALRIPRDRARSLYLWKWKRGFPTGVELGNVQKTLPGIDEICGRIPVRLVDFGWYGHTTGDWTLFLTLGGQQKIRELTVGFSHMTDPAGIDFAAILQSPPLRRLERLEIHLGCDRKTWRTVEEALSPATNIEVVRSAGPMDSMLVSYG